MSSAPRLQSVAPIFQVASMQRALDYYTLDRFYGMRDGRIDDPDGNSIQLGEPLVKS